MTVRDRYDDALRMYETGEYSISLILALIAVAGASELFRQHETQNAKKVPGDDNRYFRKYLNGLGMLDRLLKVEDRQIDVAEILYKEVRCDVVHEATINDIVDFSADTFITLDGENFRFGRQIALQLLQIVRADSLQRDSFRDLLSPFENVVRTKADDQSQLFKELEHNYGIGSLDALTLEQIVRALRPERLLAMSDDEIQHEITNRLIPSADEARIPLGLIRAMMSSDVQLVKRDWHLTAKGIAAIRWIAERYETVDAGGAL